MISNEKLNEMKIQPVSNGCIDMIYSPENIDVFIDFCTANNILIKGFTWWCHVTDGHEPCGMGGPKARFYDGWFSEIELGTVIELFDNKSYKEYFKTVWPADKEYHSCYWPGFWLEIK